LLQHKPVRKAEPGRTRERKAGSTQRDQAGHARDSGERPPRKQRTPGAGRDRPSASELEHFRIEVGRVHGVKPGNIVGAIANEAGIDSQHMGRIVINDDHSLVDLPKGMPKDVFSHLKKVRVAGQQLRISRVAGDARTAFPAARPGKPKHPDTARKQSGFKKKSTEKKKQRKNKPAK